MKLWPHGNSEFGSVTFESAGYCARYAAKKLVHGLDGQHDFKPISKKSSKHAIGKKWLEKYYWQGAFAHGYIILPSGDRCAIPRYYEKWFKENHPDQWLRYVTQTKYPQIASAFERDAKQRKEWFENLYARAPSAPNPLTKHQVRAFILRSKFEMLQKNLKL